MRLSYPQRAAAGFWIALFTFATGVWAQEAPTSGHIGSVQDWSEHHIVFSRDGLAKHPDLIDREPRIRQQLMKRLQVPNYGTVEGPDMVSASAKSSSRDWSVALDGHMATDAYPTKYTFYPYLTPSCSTDFVVFGLTNTNNANLVGLNNLYVNASGTGFCAGVTAPTALFAYNIATQTGGHIITSPVLSLDGTKVAFVESVPANGAIASAYFHVVTTNQGGNLAAPVTPLMFTRILTSGGGDTHSSPWIDYGNDIVYVGTDDGYMHKVTGVFKGTPVVDPTGWPVLIGTGLHFSPPVLDSNLGVLIFGASNGNLYQLNTSTLAIATLPVGSGLSGGIVAAPVVDVTNGTTFVVTADLGYAAGVVQVNTNGFGPQSTAELGLGASPNPPGGTTGGTAMTLYEPAFSNAYYTDPSTGVMSLCGTGKSDTSPYQFVFGFTGVRMKSTPIFKQQLSTSTAARCTAWTEFFNPNIGVGGTDYFFFGLTQDCTSPTGGVADGCVAEETNLTPSLTSAAITAKATITGGPSGIITDNYANPVTYPEASSIYCTAERQNVGYKFTQNGLLE